MIKLLDNSKITRFNYFYMMCMMVYLGYATVFARNIGDITTWGNAYAIIITAILVFKNKIKFSSSYFASIGVFLIYAIITTINNEIINPMWITKWIIWLTISYCICKTYKEKLFVVFETLMYHLCIISLIFWTLHIIMPSVIEGLVSTFQFSTPIGGEDGNVAGNIIFYTVGRVIDFNDFTYVQRNAGFAWEPGAFASYICLAIVCNSLRKDFSLKNNKVFIVFIITLLSTQSTTGLVTFIAMLLVWLVINRRGWYAFLIIPIAIYLFQLPFVQEKMLAEYQGLEVFDLSQTSNDANYTLGRMSSFLLDWQEFQRHPILGLGGWNGGTWLKQFGYDNIATISGIGEMLAMYGAIMTSLFLFLMFKTMRLISRTISKNGYLLIVAIIGMMISYSMWYNPIYICFWMYGIYYPYKKVKQ